LLQLAQVFLDQGCIIAYNLDGGSSSTMYFNGEIVNNHTDGRRDQEREVSDIVYIGY
jgi:exopolysaccharide biosynthesis protein